MKICIVAFLFYLLCMLIKEIFYFMAVYWVWLLLLAVLSMLAYWLHKERWRFKRKHSPAKTIAEMQKKESIPEITTEQEYLDFLNSYGLIRSFITKVVGVTFPNDDGTNRQDILAMCVNGEPVVFDWHTFRGAPACAVITDHGQIGYLSAELAAELDADYGEDEYIFEGHISDILGGEDGLNYGCYIMLSIYGPHDRKE